MALIMYSDHVVNRVVEAIPLYYTIVRCTDKCVHAKARSIQRTTMGQYQV